MAEVKEQKKVELQNGVPANGKVLEIGKPMNEILKEIKKPSASDRIKRAEQFEILSTRHLALGEKKTQLDKFLIANDGTQGCTMTLKSAGKSFEISNDSVIKELLTSAKIRLNSLIEISEAEVVNFII